MFDVIHEAWAQCHELVLQGLLTRAMSRSSVWRARSSP